MTARDELYPLPPYPQMDAAQSEICRLLSLLADANDKNRSLEAELSDLRLTHLAQMGQADDRYDALHGVAMGLAGCLKQLGDLMCEAFEDDDGNSGCGQCENDCTGCIAVAALAAWEKHNGK
jgi:hypothetical protein